MRIPYTLKGWPKLPYLIMAMLAIVWIVIVRLKLPWEAIPFRFEEFLYYKAKYWWEPFYTARGLLLLYFGVNLYKMSTTTNPPEVQKNAKDIPLAGFSTSATAGIFETIAFQWCLMYAFMGLWWTMNQILLDMGYNIAASIAYILHPLNLYLVGGVQPVLNHPGAWTVGIAVLCSNWKFQEGHLYQGPSGALLAYIGGLTFFRIMFLHGLLATILIHFCLDFMVFIMLAADVWVEKQVGMTGAKNRIYDWYK